MRKMTKAKKTMMTTEPTVKGLARAAATVGMEMTVSFEKREPRRPSPVNGYVVTTVQNTFDDVTHMLDNAKHALTETQTRLDKCNEEIGAEMHERRDDD